MTVFYLSRLRSVRASSVRLGGGGLKPGWTLPAKDYHQYTYQPTIPDKHYNVAHFNYAPATMWLRSKRPGIEKVLGAMSGTTTDAWNKTFGVLLRVWDEALPGFGLKCVGFLGVLLGYNIFVKYVHDRAEAYMTLEKLRLHSLSTELWESGFFKSESEDVDARMHDYNLKAMELEKEFEDILARATEKRDFSVFLEALEVPKVAPNSLPEPVSWRFATMPYGRDHPDTLTFPMSDTVDAPGSAFSVNLDAGSVGDYIERQDNKGNPIRKARHMYASVYLPPTK